MTRRSLAALLLFWAASAPFAADDPWRIAQLSTARWNAAFADGRLEEILSLYSQDAMLVQPDGAVSKDPSQIRAFWQTLIDKGRFSVDLVDVHGEKDGAIVMTTRLSDTKTLENPHQVLRYHYDGMLYSVLRRQSDGTWKAQVQRWSKRTQNL